MSGYGQSGFDTCPKCSRGLFNLVSTVRVPRGGTLQPNAVATGDSGTAQLFGQPIPFESKNDFTPPWEVPPPSGLEYRGAPAFHTNETHLLAQLTSSTPGAGSFGFVELTEANASFEVVPFFGGGLFATTGDLEATTGPLGATTPMDKVRDHNPPVTRPSLQVTATPTTYTLDGKEPVGGTLGAAPGNGAELGGSWVGWVPQFNVGMPETIWRVSPDGVAELQRLPDTYINGPVLPNPLIRSVFRQGGFAKAAVLSAENFRKCAGVRLDIENVTKEVATGFLVNVTIDFAHVIAEGTLLEGGQAFEMAVDTELVSLPGSITYSTTASFPWGNEKTDGELVEEAGDRELFSATSSIHVSLHSASGGNTLTFIDDAAAGVRTVYLNGAAAFESEEQNGDWQFVDGCVVGEGGPGVFMLTAWRQLTSTEFESAIVLLDAGKRPLFTSVFDGFGEPKIDARALNQTRVSGVWVSHDGQRMWLAETQESRHGLKADLAFTLPISAGNDAPPLVAGIFSSVAT